jgi:diacylglycerol O-acyltransferase
MQQLGFIDNVMLHDSARTPNQLCMVGIYDPSAAPGGKPGYDEVVAKLAAVLPAAPSFRRTVARVPLGLDLPYWIEDPNFDLEYHVRHLALPRPGDWKQFCVQVARLHARPLDMSRPPWELTIVDGLDGIDRFPPGCFATVLKVHHAAIDGVSGVELLNAMHDLEAQPAGEPVADDWQPEEAPSAQVLVGRAAANAVLNPIATVRMIAGNAPPLVREIVGRARNRGPGVVVPRTRLNQPVSAHRVFDEATCSLQDLKAIKNAVAGSTINDACLSIIAGAMRSYLDELGELPDEPLLTLVPVSTRTPQQAGTGGNQISGMRVSLHTHIAEPLARLDAIRLTTVEKKAAQEGVAMPVLLDVAKFVPGALIGAAMRSMGSLGSRMPIVANTIVTNVPGSPVPLYFLGCELVHSTGCVPLFDGIGIFHCVSSYRGIFVFMITADRDLVPDVAGYVKHVEASIADHLAAARAAT